MGRKVNPISFRTGQLYTWSSRWFSDKNEYKKLLAEDVKIRRSLAERLKNAGLSRVEIERSINKIDLTVFVAKPGIVIGRGGSGLEELKKFMIQLLTNKNGIKNNTLKINIKIEPVKEPNLDAHIVAQNIADQLVRRLPAKRVLKHSLEKVMQAQAKGAKIVLAGRIGGAEIARKEKIQQGVVPLSTLREKIDFAKVAAKTKMGYVGVKVWICKK
ncbi:MAG: 30S ribosomal protein S3 [Patescibacteria group bacterium]|nr:30S ribosomal protein S3 [Patescibacteria group bacterium]